MPAGVALALEQPPSGPRGTPPAKGTKAQQACAEQSQRAGLGGGGYSGEQPVRLTVDPVIEIEGIGIAVHPADPKVESPQATRSVAAAGVDRDRTKECSGRRVECVDLTIEEAEVADQQVATKQAKTGRGQRYAPGRRQLTAESQDLRRAPILVKHYHRSLSERSIPLGC